jgi:hypothetical protein
MANKFLSIFCFFVVISLSSKLMGQGTNPFPSNVITPSSYNGKGGANPNYYSGKTSVSIPLYSYGQNSIPPVNIEVGYSTTGTTLEQVASCVGLGWGINTGGLVKRIVIGTPDEFSYTQNNTQINVGFLNTGVISANPTRANLDDIYYNKIDGEPDIFAYSIPGYSGRIIIDKNQLVVGTIPETALKITFQRISTNGRINKFSIQTEQGTVYEFSDEEVLTYKTNINGTEYSFNYSSSWLLSKVYTVNNTNASDAIFYTYSTYYSNDIIGKQYFHAFPYEMIAEIASVCYGSGGACCPNSFPYNNEDLKIDGNLKRLNTISFLDGTTIKFYYKSNMRCDLEYDKALDLVTVLNPFGKVIKKYQFDFSYASSAGEVAYTSCNSLDLTKRLLLKSITELGSNNTSIPPYRFEYESSINLPARNSADVDEWGFWYKSNVSPPEGGAKAYVLNYLYNPTGSFIKYEYEFNDINWTNSSSSFRSIKGLRIKKITSNEGSDPIPSNNPNIDRVYEYKLPSNSSSGQVDFLPLREFFTYHNLTQISSNCSIMGNSFSHVKFGNGINHSPISAFPVGNACGYSVVSEEIKSGTQSLGKNLFYYKNFSDYINDPSIAGATMQFPFPNKSYNISWGLGLPQKTETYNAAGEILKRTENLFNVESNFINSTNVKGMKVGLIYGPVNRSQSNVNGDVYQYESYTPLSGKTTLSSTKNTELFYTPSITTPKTLVTDVTYEYIPGKSLPRSSSGFDSKGYKYRTVYYYPFDYTITTSSTTFPGIGLMNAHDIISVISSETWVTKNNINYLIGAAVQDYKILLNGTIKPSKSYALQNSEPIPENLVPPFNLNSIFRDPFLFKETNSIDIYSNIGNALQVTSNKYNTTSTLYYYNHSLPVAAVSNAGYNEVAYTSFEQGGGGSYPDPNCGWLWDSKWQVSGNVIFSVDDASSPTGKSCAQLNTGGAISVGDCNFIGITKDYKLSFWANSSTFSVTIPTLPIPFPPFIGPKLNGWTYYEFDLPAGTPMPYISGNNCKIDELRLYPKKATMVTTTYEPGIGKTSVCDINNHITYYEYDEFNRLSKVYDEKHNIIKTYEYHFKN